MIGLKFLAWIFMSFGYMNQPPKPEVEGFERSRIHIVVFYKGKRRIRNVKNVSYSLYLLRPEEEYRRNKSG
eukprot:snap_masked-scaffold_26-processed-gene-4.41-mRNA-1 protein AED:1.00 eAED:1.00 QI:0/-1/0/0/-1/1/1/0/70